MLAMFVRIKVDGEFREWRFEGFQEDAVRVREIEQKVVEENGEGSFFATYLPK